MLLGHLGYWYLVRLAQDLHHLLFGESGVLHGSSVALGDNPGTLVNYGARYRKGLPISSSIAESAVNQVVSHRMAKKQQMRWTDEGAHRLAQVRVADLNGELSVQRLAALAKMPGANSSYARQAA
jgi:hypothetical protein